jgi:hypothetical protein
MMPERPCWQWSAQNKPCETGRAKKTINVDLVDYMDPVGCCVCIFVKTGTRGKILGVESEWEF